MSFMWGTRVHSSLQLYDPILIYAKFTLYHFWKVSGLKESEKVMQAYFWGSL